MPGLVRIIVEVVNPGTFHRSHILNQGMDGGGIITVFEQRVLQAGFADGELIDVGEGIRQQFE